MRNPLSAAVAALIGRLRRTAAGLADPDYRKTWEVYNTSYVAMFRDDLDRLARELPEDGRWWSRYNAELVCAELVDDKGEVQMRVVVHGGECCPGTAYVFARQITERQTLLLQQGFVWVRHGQTRAQGQVISVVLRHIDCPNYPNPLHRRPDPAPAPSADDDDQNDSTKDAQHG